ncbi:putative carbonyl reductase [Lophiotrema nucula]|uniref:Putative carbonyl reductase n=1 Tax=Lophiotrema nucula TaxID=690887 RepID=A0A6A5YGL1_9PLEO|nr:putative carbonyl reductase [Lophiotrema nucula]
MATDKPVALITGANRGIGYTLAETLSRDHGFHVLLGARSQDAGTKAADTLKAKGLSVEPILLDLASDSTIIAAAKEVEAKYGKLDVLVNNAGIGVDYTWTGQVDDLRRVYKETFETNVFGSGVVTEAFIPLLSKSSLPRALFLSSTLGSISDRSDPKSIYNGVDVHVYRTSKAGVGMLGAIFAKRFRDEGWKVNVACPGFVKTDMNHGGGVLTTEESMPNLVRLCTLGEDGETGTFSDANGIVPW